MYSRCLSLLLACAIGALAGDARVLRVCADPDDLPFSNHAGQGFENKLAELVAAAMNASLEFSWYPGRKSFVKNSLAAGKCDVLTGVPSGMEDVETTTPYYRSSYVFVSRADRRLALSSLLDQRLAGWRIGINIVGDDYAPPAFALAHRGITQNITGFRLLGEPARRIIDAVDRGQVDVAIVWGPVAGYYAKTARNALVVEPVSPSAFLGVPFAFDISMGVRSGEDALKNQLSSILQVHASEVKNLLTEYGVPQVH